VSDQEPAVAARPEGWYPDETRPWVQRWWDGAAWTEHEATPRTGPPPTAEPVRRQRPAAALLVGALVAAVVVVAVAGAGLLWQRGRTASSGPGVGSSAQTGTPVGARGVALVLPSGWRSIPPDPTPAQLAALQRTDLLAAFFVTHLPASARRSMAVLGLHDVPAGDYVDNVEVTVGGCTPCGSDTAGPLSQAAIVGGLTKRGATHVVATQAQVAGSDGLKITYALPVRTSTASELVHGVAYVGFGTDHVVILTVSSSGASTDDDAQRMADSLHWG
jgi:hypothetical protein